MKKAYLAYPITYYNTFIEDNAVLSIGRRFEVEVVNPNEAIHKIGYYREGMIYFKSVIEKCFSLYAMPFEDGCIGAGVAKEIQFALDFGKPCYIVGPKDFEHRKSIISLWELNVLTVEETRERIARSKS